MHRLKLAFGRGSMAVALWLLRAPFWTALVVYRLGKGGNADQVTKRS